MIIALAGRRVDCVDARTARFPGTPANLEVVQKRIVDLLEEQGAGTIVSSAACGADLLALSAAETLGVRRIVLLPFDRETFRDSSVADRPGEWGRLYDQIIEEVEKAGDLRVLSLPSEEEAYSITNHMIVDCALSLGRDQGPVAAVLVWEGKSRGGGDLTQDFGEYARSKGLPVLEIMTL